MPFSGKVCKKGVWDETIPKIKFNQDGVSNYAVLFEKLLEEYPRGEKGKSKWEGILKKIKQSGKNKRYDCIIGVSGGTDSCYLLHLAKEYDLKPLAVNLDNGWNSDIAVKNIKKVTSSLNIDLETYVINYEEIKDLLRSYVYAGLPWVDMPTDLAIKSIIYKIANREGVKFVLRGNDFRSEGNQPTEWTYGDDRQLRYLHRKFGKTKLKTYPHYSLTNLFYLGFIKNIKSIYPFYFVDYNKNWAQSFLKEKYGWEYYGGHHYENIFTRFVMSYWLFKKFGIDKRKITLSAQVLSGEISREYALSEINKLPYDENKIDEMIDFVTKKLDLSRNEFEEIMQSKNYSFYDYPSDYKIIVNTSKYFKKIFRLFFLHKPQYLFKAEIIDS